MEDCAVQRKCSNSAGHHIYVALQELSFCLHLWGRYSVIYQLIACQMSNVVSCHQHLIVIHQCRTTAEDFDDTELCMSISEEDRYMSITTKSVSVPTTTTGFLSVCAKVSAVDMSVRARWWSPTPRRTLANCCQIHSRVRCLCHLHSASLRRSIGCCV